MTDKEFNLDQISLQQKRQDAVNSYPGVWNKVIEEWNRGDVGNSARLTYAANYLLLTNGVRWAIDLFR